MSRLKVRYTTCKTTMNRIYCQRCSPFLTNTSLELSQIRTLLKLLNKRSHQYRIISSRRQVRLTRTYLQKILLPQSQTRLRLNLVLLNFKSIHKAAVLANSLHLLKQSMQRDEKQRNDYNKN